MTQDPTEYYIGVPYFRQLPGECHDHLRLVSLIYSVFLELGGWPGTNMAFEIPKTLNPTP